jgi:hypothetical protein
MNLDNWLQGISDWFQNKRNIFTLIVPILFILGCIFFKIYFIIGTIFGIIVYHFRDFGMDDKNG